MQVTEAENRWRGSGHTLRRSVVYAVLGHPYLEVLQPLLTFFTLIGEEIVP